MSNSGSSSQGATPQPSKLFSVSPPPPPPSTSHSSPKLLPPTFVIDKYNQNSFSFGEREQNCSSSIYSFFCSHFKSVLFFLSSTVFVVFFGFFFYQRFFLPPKFVEKKKKAEIIADENLNEKNDYIDGTVKGQKRGLEKEQKVESIFDNFFKKTNSLFFSLAENATSFFRKERRGEVKGEKEKEAKVKTEDDSTEEERKIEELDGEQIDEMFDEICDFVRKNPRRFSNDAKLKFYGMYKQALFGDCKKCEEDASIFDAQSKLKRESWLQFGSLSPKEAKISYIKFFQEKLQLSNIFSFLRNFKKNENTNWSFFDENFHDNSPAEAELFSHIMRTPVSTLKKAHEMEENKDTSPGGVFCELAANGDISEILRILKEENSIVNYRNEDGMTALHFAADRGHLEIAKALILHGIDVNAQDEEGETALHMAIVAEKVDMIKLLIKHKGDPNIINTEGENCFEVAEKTSNEDVKNAIFSSE